MPISSGAAKTWFSTPRVGLLEKGGHAVCRFLVRNDRIVDLRSKIAAAISVLNNKASVTDLLCKITAFQPDIVHFHNFFPSYRRALLKRLPCVASP